MKKQITIVLAICMMFILTLSVLGQSHCPPDPPTPTPWPIQPTYTFYPTYTPRPTCTATATDPPTPTETCPPTHTPRVDPSPTPYPTYTPLPTDTPYPVSMTYYVALDGDDSNPGTEAEPWRTIQKAANTLQANETVFVRAGTYLESVRPANSGTVDNPITYQAYPGEQPIIDGQGTRSTGFGIVDREYIRIVGFKIQNIGGWGKAISIGRSSYIEIKDNVFDNNHSDGVFIYDDSHYNIIEGNEFRYNFRGGVYLWTADGGIRSTDNVIRDNVFDHDSQLRDGNYNENFESAIQIIKCDDNLVERNTITDCAHQAITIVKAGGNIIQDNVIDHNGIGVLESPGDRAAIVINHCDLSGNVVRRNIISRQLSPVLENGNYKLHGSGVIVDWGSAIVEVYQNVIFDNSGFGIDVFNDSNDLIYNNTVFSNREFPPEYEAERCPNDSPAEDQGCYYHPSYLVGEIRDGSGTTNNTYINNIAYSDTDMAAFADRAQSVSLVNDYNLFYKVTDNYVVSYYYTPMTLADYQDQTGKGNDCIGADPLFIDEEAHDFHLQFGSPAIDAGIAMGLLYNGLAPDFGAYEY